MMKYIPFYLASLAVVLAASGCRTHHHSVSRTASVGREQLTPFLTRGDYSDRLGLALRDALTAHRFTIPWTAIRGSDASLWFVADRFQSEHRFDRIEVQVRQDEQVTASITAYQFGPSDWAILGTRFADLRSEAESISAEIATRLDGHKGPVER